jgi:hypothetical protein
MVPEYRCRILAGFNEAAAITLRALESDSELTLPAPRSYNEAAAITLRARW